MCCIHGAGSYPSRCSSRQRPSPGRRSRARRRPRHSQPQPGRAGRRHRSRRTADAAQVAGGSTPCCHRVHPGRKHEMMRARNLPWRLVALMCTDMMRTHYAGAQPSDSPPLPATPRPLSLAAPQEQSTDKHFKYERDYPPSGSGIKCQEWILDGQPETFTRRSPMSEMTRVGVDFAKSVIQVNPGPSRIEIPGNQCQCGRFGIFKIIWHQQAQAIW